jgi:hypothetical protein
LVIWFKYNEVGFNPFWRMYRISGTETKPIIEGRTSYLVYRRIRHVIGREWPFVFADSGLSLLCRLLSGLPGASSRGPLLWFRLRARLLGRGRGLDWLLGLLIGVLDVGEVRVLVPLGGELEAA